MSDEPLSLSSVADRISEDFSSPTFSEHRIPAEVIESWRAEALGWGLLCSANIVIGTLFVATVEVFADCGNFEGTAGGASWGGGAGWGNLYGNSCDELINNTKRFAYVLTPAYASATFFDSSSKIIGTAQSGGAIVGGGGGGGDKCHWTAIP